MAEASDGVSTTGLVDTKSKPLPARQRREWPDALKRQMVAETLEPGASVSIVARQHDVNTNQLFSLRAPRHGAGNWHKLGGGLIPSRGVGALVV
jgi:transposase-like protein